MTMRERGAVRGAAAVESAYGPALGQAICARVAAGESLRRIGAEAGWPTPQAVWKWAQLHSEFGEALAQAQRTARMAARLADRATARRSAEARAARGQPWRRGGRPLYCEPLAREICDRLIEGETLIAICRDPDMPAYRTVMDWLQARPEFQDRYVMARQLQADWLFDEAREVALAATPRTVWADRLRFDAIRWRSARLAPHKYAESVIAIDAAAQAREAEREAASGPRLITIRRFERGPNGEVLSIPPMDEAQEQDWVRAYGKPYDGPRPVQRVDPR